MSEQDAEKLEIQFKKTRKQLIDGDLYINLDDFRGELDEAVKSLDDRVMALLQLGAIMLAAEVYRWGDIVAHIGHALEYYSNEGKFDEIVKEEE